MLWSKSPGVGLGKDSYSSSCIMLHPLQCFRVSLLSAGSQSQRWAFEALPCSDSAVIRCYQMGPLTPTKSHCMHLALVEDVASVKCSPRDSSLMRLLFWLSRYFGRVPCTSTPWPAWACTFRTHELFKPRNKFTAKTCWEKMSRSGHLDHCLFLGQVEATRAKSSHFQCNVWSKHSLRSSSVQPWISQWNKSQKDLRAVSHDYIIRRVRMTWQVWKSFFYWMIFFDLWVSFASDAGLLVSHLTM